MDQNCEYQPVCSGISGERTSPHYERRRQHSFYRLLRRTAGLFLISGLRRHQIRHHFLTKSLVKELEPKQIRVNAIAPGFIETSWHKNRTPESYERINRKVALHRFGEISEVADMAYEVLKNGYMNGSVVDIHGGYDYF